MFVKILNQLRDRSFSLPLKPLRILRFRSSVNNHLAHLQNLKKFKALYQALQQMFSIRWNNKIQVLKETTNQMSMPIRHLKILAFQCSGRVSKMLLQIELTNLKLINLLDKILFRCKILFLSFLTLLHKPVVFKAKINPNQIHSVSPRIQINFVILNKSVFLFSTFKVSNQHHRTIRHIRSCKSKVKYNQSSLLLSYHFLTKQDLTNLMFRCLQAPTPAIALTL